VGAVACECPFDDKAQESGKLRGAVKCRARRDALNRSVHLDGWNVLVRLQGRLHRPLRLAAFPQDAKTSGRKLSLSYWLSHY
jgi:hypothetical protein